MKHVCSNKKSFFQKSIFNLLFPKNITYTDLFNPENSKFLYKTTSAYKTGDVCFLNYDNPVWYKCINDTTGIFDSSKWDIINFDNIISSSGAYLKLVGGGKITSNDNEVETIISNDEIVVEQDTIHKPDPESSYEGSREISKICKDYVSTEFIDGDRKSVV